MYYLISMYHPRDISKTFFEMKKIMVHFSKDGGKTTYFEIEKEKLLKFFISIFFDNKVNNNVMLNNISSKLQKEINEFKMKMIYFP